MNRNRFVSAVAAVAAGAVILTGCAAAADDTDAPAADAPLWTEADADLAARYAELSAGTFTIATDVTVGLPWASTDEADGTTPVGLDIDLGIAIAEVLGADYAVENTAFDTLIPGVVGGRYTIAVSAHSDTEARREQVDFVDFVYDASGILIHKNSPLSENLTMADMCGLTVGVIRGGVEEGYALTASDECVAGGEPAIVIEAFQSLQDAELAVASERIDVLLGDKVRNAYIEALPNANLKQSGDRIGEVLVGLLVAKDSEMTTLVADAMGALIESGVYGQILDTWGLTDAAVDGVYVNTVAR